MQIVETIKQDVLQLEKVVLLQEDHAQVMQEILQLVLDMLELKDFVLEMPLELNAELENVMKN